MNLLAESKGISAIRGSCCIASSGFSPALAASVCPSAVSASNPASRPIPVAMPVAVTMVSRRPRVTTVFMNTMFCRSASADFSSSASDSLATACDSPVKAASATSALCADSTRASA
jgi:hypothetical protein